MNNKQFSVGSVVIIGLVVLGFGYFLFRTSPQTASRPAPQAVDTMHSAQGNVSASAGDADLLVGKPLPDIQLVDKNGKTYTAEGFKGKITVLFFNEGLMCYPACWNQIVGFGSDARFNTSEVQAISVVLDPSKDWQ
ncbi:MAG: redoxin domain-containing protein, partial [Patescibacteria group bacterium]